MRGKVLTFNDDPGVVSNTEAVSYWDSGAVLIENGIIKAVGDFQELESRIADDVDIRDFADHLILPGFIDGHVHYPQLGVIASYGTKLIDWLNAYTFPAEAEFGDLEVARATAELFLDELLKNGFTTAAVYCTSHPESVDAFFAAAQQRSLRMIAGKVLMDRHAPDELCDTAKSGYDQSKELIEKWHENGRCLYAVTPRFAPTSSPEQLEAAGALYAEFDDVYVQSHVSENVDEINWVAKLFPESESYLDVYNRFGLLGPRTLYGHGIHFSEAETRLAAETDTAIVHCPTSNLFLGSGLFDYQGMRQKHVPIALGTDVGGGTSLSPFATMKAAYEIAQFRDNSISPKELFYMATLGGAKALQMDGRVGRLAPEYEADLTVIDLNSTPLIRYRMERAEKLDDILFTQIILADDRAIKATYADGRLVYERDN